MKTRLGIAFLIWCGFWGVHAGADPGAEHPSVVTANNKAVEALAKKNYSKAKSELAPALRESPDSPVVQYNLGLAFDGAGEPEKAKQAYLQSLKTAREIQSQFSANFNLGELAARDQKVAEALQYYQASLAANPDSIEAKTNIELLVQQNSDQKQNKNQKDSQEQKNQKDSKKNQQQSKDEKKDKDQNKDQNKDGKPDQPKPDEPKDNKDQDGDKKDNDKQEQHHAPQKPQPKPFQSPDLSPGDVKKILEELDRQEQRVRAEYNKKQVKERPRDKDW